MTPFDFLNSINQTKEDLFQDPQAEKDYTPFMVNRGLSYFLDTVLYANQMNIYNQSPKKWQFQFFINTIARKKRFSKWHKKDAQSESLKLVMQYYGYSTEKAKEALKVLSADQLTTIKNKFETGGKK